MSDMTVIRGDEPTFAVTVTADSVDVDLTDALAVTFTAKRAYRDDDVDALIRKDLDGGLYADEDGIHVEFVADDTNELAAPMILVWDIEVVDADGKTHTVDGGYLRIEADVTRTSSYVPGSGS